MNLDQSSDGRLIQFHSACSNYSFTWTSFQFIFLKFTMFYNSVFLFFFYLVGNASHESLFPVRTSPFGSTAFFLLCSLKISAIDQRLFLEKQLYPKLLHATATGMRQSRVTSQGQNLTQCCIFFHISVEIIGQFFLVPSGEKSDVCIKPVDAQNFHSASYYGKT